MVKIQNYDPYETDIKFDVEDDLNQAFGRGHDEGG